MRILWLSNHSRVGTGYGNQTNLFTKAIKDAGHEIVIVPFYGLEGAPEYDHNGILNLPRAAQLYGNDIIQAHAKYTHAELVVTLIDPFVLDPSVYSQLPWVAWSPIDSEPILPANAQVLQSSKRVWAMSRHGERMLNAAGFANVDYVPHGVDTNAFKPIARDEARSRLGKQLGMDLSGKYLITTNSANKGQPGRKGFFEMFSAFAGFVQTHPDALLYMHTDKYGTYGEHLPTVQAMFGEALRDKVIYADPYYYIAGMLNQAYLNDVYNAGDVFLTTSHGEGFGIPIVEAQSAGCPVIVTDFSAMSELCFGGWKVPGLPFMHAPGASQRIPIIPMVAQALEQAYQRKGDQSLRDQARVGALDYDAKTVFEKYMIPALEKAYAQQQVATVRQQVIEIPARVKAEAVA
jgi:glycosyltransferase involved in cell wall biosynthesis